MPTECTTDVFRIEVMLRKDAGRGGVPIQLKVPHSFVLFLQIPPEWSLKQTNQDVKIEKKNTDANSANYPTAA